MLVPALAILCCTVFIYYLRNSIRRRKLPPGPSKLPLLGNLLQIPKEKAWVTFREWGHQFHTNIVALTALSQDIIVLNRAEDAYELLHKRSPEYSNRPQLIMVSELMDWRLVIGLHPHAPRHTKMRRLVHQALMPQMWPLVEEETQRFVHWIVKKPEDYKEHIRRLAGAISLKIAYGYIVCEPEEGHDSLVTIVEKSMKEFSIAVEPGAFLVDLIPWLRYVPPWFPGAMFKKKAAEWRNDFHTMVEMPYAYTKAQVAKGTAIPSLASIHIRRDMPVEEEDLIKYAAASLYAAGADTTVSVITTFFLAMTLHPDIQRKAQAEIDSVIDEPGHRLPKITDRHSLPYIEAVMKETFRWIPVAPLGLPHLASQDDSYNEYLIPAGATMLANIWAMTRDPRYFPDPEVFRPERYLEKDFSDSPFANPLQLVFGFGRRICPGQKLAEASVFLAIATMLATFDITKAKDPETGLIIEPKLDVISGTICDLQSFSCNISPRSQDSSTL
ncbi:hypothetical protein M422DRAFT_25570 [Sphaerobolus stellatus SS14]|nr:hypothetical protein M422DRAFT_25570 [Sphaerobolus stellatus SS14]